MQINSNQRVIKDNNVIKVKISDVSAVLNRIGEQYEQQQEKIKDLKEQILNFRADAYKDQELKEMKETYDSMKNDYYRGFPISKSEMQNIKNWMQDHENKHHGGYPCYHGVSGGGYIYQFHPTAIGTIGEIICNSCKRKAFKESFGDWTEYQELLKEYDGIFIFKDII